MTKTGENPAAPLPWAPLSLFFAGWMMMYANRSVLSPVLSVLEEEWALSQAALGLANSVFFLAYSALQVPAGILGDRRGRKPVLVGSTLLHGAGALSGGLAWAYGAFLMTRLVTGLGQSAYYATQYAIASVLLPEKRRALGFSMINSGQSFGIALGWVAGAYLVHQVGFGWRLPFFLAGGATLILAALFQRILPSPQPAATMGAPSPRASLRQAIADGRLWRLYLANFSLMYGFFMMLTWLPYFLEQVHGLPGGRAGLLAALLPLASVPAMIAAGRLGDVPNLARRLLFVLVPTAGFALLLVQSGTILALICGLVLYGATGKLVTDTLLLTELTHATAAASRATVYSVFNFAGTLSMILAPTITGLLADLTGNFGLGFWLAAGLHGVALAAVVTIPRTAVHGRV